MIQGLLYGDVSCAARAILNVAQDARPQAATALLEQTEMAVQYVRQYGAPHPEYGNGTLMGTARQSDLTAEPTYSNLEYCKAVIVVLQAIVGRYEQQPNQEQDCNWHEKDRY